jgi:hypothetical protein
MLLPPPLANGPVPPAFSGRVDLVPGSAAADYPLFSQPGGSRRLSGVALGSLRQMDTRESPLAQAFFSDANIEAVQQAVRYGVFRASGAEAIVIGRQSDTELLTVMRSIYQQFGRNQPVAVLHQVRELNAKVLNFCVPRVLQEVLTHQRYQRDISRPRELMAHGTIAGSKGSRQLEVT